MFKQLTAPVLVAAAIAGMSGCSSEPEAPSEPVENVWVRLPAVDGRPAAAYFTLNGGETDDRLIAIDSPRVARIELHESVADGDRMQMRPLDSVDVAAGDVVTFEPGGMHGMLFSVSPEITPGTPLELNFRFDTGRDVIVEAQTIAAGEEMPSHGSGDSDAGGDRSAH